MRYRWSAIAHTVQVYIVGRTQEKLDTIVKTYSQGIAGQIIPIVADVSEKDDIAKLYEQISQKESHLDM
jgi:short-subunit dehydrogenase